MTDILPKIFVTMGSCVSVAFGIWHFTVPGSWKWYSYIDAAATELVAAVRAINVFFSLSLVLFGLMNVFLIYEKTTSRYSLLVVLSATCILWLARVVMQLVYPQGSMSPILRYGMLAAFVTVFLFYVVSLILSASAASFHSR